MIIKVSRPERYTIVSNAAIHDKRLSWDARGLLIWLLSKPANWTVSSDALCKESPAGKDKVSRILRELEGLGYLVRTQNHNADGTFSWESFVYEEAQPLAGNPTLDNPMADNPPLLSTDRTSTDQTITEQTQERERLFRKFYDAYPKKSKPHDARARFFSKFPNVTEEFVDMLIADIKARYATTPRQFIPGPAPYLKSGEWEVPLGETNSWRDAPRLTPQEKPATNADFLTQLAERFTKGREEGRAEF